MVTLVCEERVSERVCERERECLRERAKVCVGESENEVVTLLCEGWVGVCAKEKESV